MHLPLVAIPSNRYIVAVSGGVDSMVLLDALRRQQPTLELIVAHFDHGIRADSDKDAQLVGEVAASMGLHYCVERAELGAAASEAVARQARYAFLRRVKKQYDAQAIITAHHQDDVLETAILNILRGTGWRGLASLRSTAAVIRPMINIAKSEILAYAQERQLHWREDSTNANVQYARNAIRLQLLPLMTARDQEAIGDLQRIIDSQNQLRGALDSEIQDLFARLATDVKGQIHFKRIDLVRLPLSVCLEVLRAAAVRLSGTAVERPALRRMRIFACSARPAKQMEITKYLTMRVSGDSIIVYNR